MKKVKEIQITEQISIGGENKPFVLFAGPCIIENDEMIFDIAKELKEITRDLKLQFIFKTSFDKANRSSIDSFRGPGLEKGLELLKKVKADLEIPLLIDIHLPEQADPVAEVAAILQIPAFLCRQTDLVTAAAKTGKPVNVKKGQFLAPWDMKNIIDKIKKTGNEKIIMTERGSSFGYNNLVVDMRGIPIMREMGYPVIFDATHSAQLPGGAGTSTGGMRDSIPFMARAAVAAGIDGLFMEVHPEPEKGLSDASNMYPLYKLKYLLEELIKIDQIVKS
ncbi:3-deoxy-8-phosphooctulonate synthase [Candidatus Dependentiae bacterium]|nr:3-deoxy-8-phosphooctulonate synthase [Candidatus Dependentiae bacterium]